MTSVKTLADLKKNDTFRRPGDKNLWTVLRKGKKEAECRDETGNVVWFKLYTEVEPGRAD
jgi:3'-phosphoadenosine 5'-phosphosulfate sulfotransferase